MTKDLEKALNISSRLKAGTVWVNSYDVFDPAVPFGGFKDSGLGRELGEAGLRGYLESKVVVMRRPADSLPW